MQLPPGRISGRALRALVTAVRKTPARRIVAKLLRQQLGIDALRALGMEHRTDLPFDLAPIRARAGHARPSQERALPSHDGWPTTSRTLSTAYRKGNAEPEEVARRAFAAARELAARAPSLAPLLAHDEPTALGAARDALQRIRAGKARSAFDGVPLAIKEEVDVAGLPTRLGTAWMPSVPAAADSTAVARLRATGAVVLGHTPMTEYGMSPLGNNTNRVMPRNPHDPTRLPGGSSSGSAVAVALGICPVALGADGGGSIRTPACLNGVFGLKPTFGRVPVSGHGLPGGSSVVHLGPIGASTEDLALFVDAAAGPHEHDPASLVQPPLEHGALGAALGRGVDGLRIGIDEREWEAAERDVAEPARRALGELERAGAILVPVTIEMARHAAAIGYLTIATETFTSLFEVRRDHMDELGPDLQLLLANVESFRTDDYLDAQRLRGALRLEVAARLREVDVLALPTTACSAPPVTDAEAREGFVDPPALDAICRFAFLANLTGLPAGSAPVGTDSAGLPVGLQIISDAWDEAAVLQVLVELERSGAARVIRPPNAIDLLQG